MVGLFFVEEALLCKVAFTIPTELSAT